MSEAEHFQAHLDSLLLVNTYHLLVCTTQIHFLYEWILLRANTNHIYEHIVQVKALLLYSRTLVYVSVCKYTQTHTLSVINPQLLLLRKRWNVRRRAEVASVITRSLLAELSSVLTAAAVCVVYLHHKSCFTRYVLLHLLAVGTDTTPHKFWNNQKGNETLSLHTWITNVKTYTSSHY